jgi:hypothetical protein
MDHLDRMKEQYRVWGLAVNTELVRYNALDTEPFDLAISPIRG